MEECSLDLFFNRDRPFGFLVGRGAVLFFPTEQLKTRKKIRESESIYYL